MKHITTAEGGAVLTNNEDVYKYDVTATSPIIAVCIICMTVIILSEAGKLRKL